MKLSDDDLKSLWQDDTSPAQDNRVDCLPTDLLTRAGAGELCADEREHVTAHLTQCAECAQEYRLALSIHDWSAPAAARHAAAFSAQPDTNLKHSAPAQPDISWWQRAGAWLMMPGLKAPALIVGTALAALVLLAIGWLVWQTRQKTDLPPETADATPAPVVTPSLIPTQAPVPANIVAQLSDGPGQITLDEQGQLAGVDYLPPAYQQMVKKALTTPRLESSPLLAGLRQPASELRSGGDKDSAFTLLEPVGKVVLSERPRFRWSQLSEATSYVVEVYDEKFNLLLTSPALTMNTWTAAQSLQRDGTYSWQVKAVKGGQEIKAPQPDAPQATFRVLGHAKANELAQAQRRFGAAHLTLGLLYVETGLLDEAEQEFRALQRANPTSPIARRLLANVRALRR